MLNKIATMVFQNDNSWPLFWENLDPKLKLSPYSMKFGTEKSFLWAHYVDDIDEIDS